MSETKPKPNPVNEPAAPVATKTLHIVKPLGHVTVPALVCGIVASFIAVALDLMKLYDSLILGVQGVYRSCRASLDHDVFTLIYAVGSVLVSHCRDRSDRVSLDF